MSRAIASRYQPVLVVLHWLLALLIIGLLCLGFFVLANTLITGHITAAIYHQFVLKDGLFRRMWFGERTIVPAENIEGSGHRPLRRA